MHAQTFWKLVTMDKADFLAQLIDFLHTEGIQYAVIGGQGVNAYVDPLVSLDLGLAVAVEQFNALKQRLAMRFQIKRFPHSLNVSLSGSDLRVRIQTDARYAQFVSRAAPREVLGVTLPVATLRDVLQGKSGPRKTQSAAPANKPKTGWTSCASSNAIPNCATWFPRICWPGCCNSHDLYTALLFRNYTDPDDF